MIRRQRRKPREAERKLVAALALGQRMRLVDDDGAQDPNRRGAFSCDRSNASDSGVVSRICGGSRRWRARWDCLVSPVRSSTRIGSPISATGAERLRRISAASAFSGET
jgi:hypothetical protein